MPFKLLIAEDNEADLYLIRESLNASGLEYEAREAGNGEEVFALIGGPSGLCGFDGLILDLNLTTHSGLDILQTVRKNTAFAGIRVIILTSSLSPDDERRALALGADAYLHKPMDLLEFMQVGTRIAALLQGSTGQAAGV